MLALSIGQVLFLKDWLKKNGFNWQAIALKITFTDPSNDYVQYSCILEIDRPMQLTDPADNFQQQVLAELKQIKTDVEKLNVYVEKLDYKFDTYQKASDQVVRLATTIVIAAATVAVLPSAIQAIGPAISTIVSKLVGG